MQDFYQELFQYKIWNQESFVQEQLIHHLEECKELLISGDQHLFAELIDLVQIAKVVLHMKLSEDECNILIQQRHDKFVSKTLENQK